MLSKYCFNVLNKGTISHRFNCYRKINSIKDVFFNNGPRNLYSWTNFVKPKLSGVLKVGVRSYATKTEDEENRRSNRHRNKLNISNLSSDSNENVTQQSFLTNLELNKIQQIYYADTEETKQTLKMFPSPKNVLHNIFTLLVQETKNNSLHLAPSFKSLSNQRGGASWICTYNIGWPTQIKFLAKDNRKKVASDKAALAALTWLRLNNKITTNGAPIIYDKEEVKQLTKGSIPLLNLRQKTLENIDKIINVYEEKMNPHILKCQDSSVIQSKDVLTVAQEHELHMKSITKKFLGFQKYIAKEKHPLPITAYKEQFIEMLNTNQVIIVKGEPGCGKSTRIPQYVLEAWVREHELSEKTGMIAVTQPRRIAAISLAERVCSERNESVGHIVGYQVRLNSVFRPLTGRILYCTTGILLRHVQSDSSLSEFSHIILDEAHERDVNTDLLMNILKLSLKKNPNLKLIVMSATIDTDMFKNYYNGAPVIEIPGFTYPVERFFIDNLNDLDLTKTKTMCESYAPSVVHEDVVKVIDYINCTKPEGAILCFLPGWDDIAKVQRMIPQRGSTVVYCLHSRLNDKEQFKIFSKPPPGVRKIILATNIAETSVTIDDVVYVVDTGIHKEQRFDTSKGIKCVDNNWISKASAIQRCGRAGRVQPGQSFHLYTQSKHDCFEEYTLPEILRTSLTKIVLDSKAFSNNMDTLTFMKSLPTPPEEVAVSKAVEELKEIELLDENENLTTLGRTLAEFQLEPKLAKTLVNSYIYKCLSPIIDIITLFSTDTEIFSSGLIDKETIKEIKSEFSENSDHLAMMRIFEKFLEFDEIVDADKLRRFCRDLNLIPHKMEMFRKLRKIHSDYLVDGLHDVLPFSDDYSDKDEFVKAVLYSGVGNILQHRTWDIVKNRLKNNTNVLLTRNNHKATITPESVNYRRYKFPTNYLLYINETRSNIRRTTLVRECSFLTNLSVLLFSNKKLKIDKVCDKDAQEGVENEHIELVLENTNIKFVCKKKEAEKIIRCKEVIHLCYGYFIAQLTRIGERNEDVNAIWSDILELINEVINDNTK
ncbi:ATP-dependent RNA helicase DHX30-like isoform X1 [Diorhabda sublineata]|uniref:ATP-dependent RNA helicase DHX30-like isoform X1 n=2 Tax=Diorhabda sublineata TaxID=1163346 RepID=UPI0024E139C9|nr:ATP-dependent RNA helicase DHX30-like isoform X1 [Diorhabda sublineata]